MRQYHIHMIRHGLTDANVTGKYIGVTDLPLSKDGKKRLMQQRKKSNYPFVELVYTSPLTRAVQTAQILYPEVEQAVVDGLREYDFGDFENRSIETLAKEEQYQTWLEQGGGAPPNGEEPEEFTDRICQAFSDLLINMMQRGIFEAALIGHAGVLAALLSRYGLPQKDVSFWKMGDGEGFTISTSAALWARDSYFEVFDRIPFAEAHQTKRQAQDYHVVDQTQGEEQQ